MTMGKSYRCPKCNRNAPRGQSGLYPREWVQYFCDPCGRSFTVEKSIVNHTEPTNTGSCDAD